MPVESFVVSKWEKGVLRIYSIQMNFPRVKSENMLHFQIPIESLKSSIWSTRFHGLVPDFTDLFHAPFLSFRSVGCLTPTRI